MCWLSRILVTACFLAPAVAPRASAQHEHVAGDQAALGSVSFPVSCAPSIQPDFNRAVALLHSFWYKKAEETFAGIAKTDPSCGIAYWGMAMSHYHQIWDPPGPGDLQAGAAAINAALSAPPKTQRERDYLAAMETFYSDYPHRSHAERALAYESAMQQLSVRYPQDQEAAIFYALAVRANAPLADKTYTNQKKASAILEALFAKYPDHPGLAHYIIHCDDYPALAPHALDAARRYAKIAPDAPHALHMPSHIFTRLGLWQESIDSNLASAASARKNGLIGDELHAMDYLVYAYLQTGQDEKALELAKAVPKPQPNDAAYFTALYATAVIPARVAIERHRWSDAAALAIPPDVFPGGRYAWTESDLYFARALGAARGNDGDALRQALQQMASLHDRLIAEHNAYYAEQVAVQRQEVNAWAVFRGGNTDDGLDQMRAAADREDATEKLPVTPGAVVPARELLGEMLLEAKQPLPALAAFEASLQVAPERLNGLLGAARSAQAAGNAAKASAYYARLVANCPSATADRAELREARAFLGQK